MNPSPRQGSTLDDLLALADTELSLAARLGQLTLLLAFVTMIGVVGFLGVSEASLPSRVRMLFGAIIGIGAVGAAVALRTLTSRGALLARQRVVAGQVAVGLSALVALGAGIIGFVRGIPAAYAVAGFGALLLAGTVAVLRQENGRLAALTARRRTLAEQLNRGPIDG